MVKENINTDNQGIIFFCFHMFSRLRIGSGYKETPRINLNIRKMRGVLIFILKHVV